MNRKISRGHVRIGALVSAAVAAVLLHTATPALAAVEDPPPVAGAAQGLERLSDAEIALYQSDDLKRIRIEASSGMVESVEPLTATQLEQALKEAEALSTGTPGASTRAVTTGCTSTSPCWYGVGPVYSYSFTLGTTNGTWGNRGDFYTGNYYAKLCWIDPWMSLPSLPGGTYCMPERNGKNAIISLGGTFTGKQVNLSTTR